MIEKREGMIIMIRRKAVQEKAEQNEEGCTAKNVVIVIGGAPLAKVNIWKVRLKKLVIGLKFLKIR